MVLLAAKKPVAIEVVGESWWHNLIGPGLIAIAAIVAAAVAAYVAIHNHRLQLEHDREERDREHARESIRAASETVAETLDPLGTYELAVRDDDKATKHAETLEGSGDEEAKEAAEKAQLKAAEEVHEAREKVGDLVIKMTVDSIGLRTSFGSRSPVFQSYRDLSRAFNRRFRACAPTTEGRVQRETAEGDSEVKKTRVALNAFQEACEEWAVQQRMPARRFGWLTDKLHRQHH
jgi:hypothetical protein